MILILSRWFHCAAALALNCGKLTNKKQDTWSPGHTGACKMELGSYGRQDLEAGKGMASLVLSAVWGQLVQSLGEMGLVRTTFLRAGAKAKMMSVSGGVRRNTAPWPAAAAFLGSSGLWSVHEFHTASAGGAGKPPLLQALFLAWDGGPLTTGN